MSEKELNDKKEEIKLYNKQLILLVSAICISLYSIYTVNKSKEKAMFGGLENFNPDKNGLLITVSTLIIIFFYWDIAYKKYINVVTGKNPSQNEKKEAKLNLFARTLILASVLIDLYLIVKTLKKTTT